MVRAQLLISSGIGLLSFEVLLLLMVLVLVVVVVAGLSIVMGVVSWPNGVESGIVDGAAVVERRDGPEEAGP